MKTLLSFLLIVFISVSSNAQKTTAVAQKSGTHPSGILTQTQPFSISKIYPNPVKDFVTVDLQSDASGPVQIYLYNILGTEVQKWEPINLSPGDQKLKIDLSMIKSGIYILKLSKSDQVVSRVLKKN